MRFAPAALAVAALLVTACGSTPTSSPPWVASHPATGVVAFDTTAPGLCAFLPQYADEAPAAIEYGGTVYVQAGRGPAATPAPGTTALATSGDWVVTRDSATALTLHAPGAVYRYRAETSC